MLLIEGWLKLGAGEFEKVREQGIAMVKATNEEAGCLHYSFAQDISDPDLIRISERWESQEALAAHSASAHMAEFNKAMGSVKREGADLWLYSAEQVRKLM
ncbi:MULTISPECIES: antibiotic biosynthesis monooxygenase [unclassified Novosphingobium]|jgi:quinol monooxygenase YgiN|uniref:putative quinol monooxygenase n=1 Tax=unclassified Novosphingobium TaxID=2644732 RepID=UPI000EDC7E13|nr:MULTISPECIES: antibiotic biosynthesis monooxygenase [unclassified Novosphingobium]HCF25440.1 antibiotic biosynthesis monooxygenase [Novosphingobium sp.]HQV04548.1 antibiotic biosynthesis monooxygenase [Novosphingobium sp.]